MSVEVKGLIEIVDYLDSKLLVAKQNKPLRDASKVVLRSEIATATRMMNKRSEGVGVKALRTFPVKVLRNGNRIQSTGIRGRQTPSQRKKEQKDVENGVYRATYWEQIKGLWFQNYGYVNHINGKYYAGNHWMDIAYDSCVEEAYSILLDGMNELWD